MIITCNKCSTRFNLDDSLVKEGGSKCRCAVCKHILTAYPLPLEPEPVQPETVLPEPVQPETEEAEPKAREPWEIEQTPEQASDFEYESDLDDDDLFKENSDIEMESLENSSKDSDLEMEDLDLSSKDSDIEMENPYMEFNKNGFEIDDDFSLEKNTFDMEEETPLSRDPEILQPEPSQTGILESEPGEMAQLPEEASDFNFESDLDDDDFFKGNSDLEMEDLDLSSIDSDLEMADFDLSSIDSDIKMENPDLDMDENDLESDDDFSFEKNTFDMGTTAPSQKNEAKKNYPEFEDPDIQIDAFEEDPISFDEPAPFSVKKGEPIISPEPQKPREAEPVFTPRKYFPEDDESLEKKAKEIDPPPPKKRKVIVKPRPAVTAKPQPIVTARPKPIKEKKKSFFRIPFIILMLIFLLAIGAYIASVMTGYKLPAIDQYIKKPIPEISEAKPIPNQKSVNGRFVTNSTAGTLFVITGRVENPSNIAYSHIEIRGALITTNKEEAKIKNVFCGNIITEDMLKTGNISDINTLLSLKEGAHKINVNVVPGASIPFMVVFSDLPEKLENFTIKVAGFDKSINTP